MILDVFGRADDIGAEGLIFYATFVDHETLITFRKGNIPMAKVWRIDARSHQWGHDATNAPVCVCEVLVAKEDDPISSACAYRVDKGHRGSKGGVHGDRRVNNGVCVGTTKGEVSVWTWIESDNRKEDDGESKASLGGGWSSSPGGTGRGDGGNSGLACVYRTRLSQITGHQKSVTSVTLHSSMGETVQNNSVRPCLWSMDISQSFLWEVDLTVVETFTLKDRTLPLYSCGSVDPIKIPEGDRTDIKEAVFHPFGRWALTLSETELVVWEYKEWDQMMLFWTAMPFGDYLPLEGLTFSPSGDRVMMFRRTLRNDEVHVLIYDFHDFQRIGHIGLPAPVLSYRTIIGPSCVGIAPQACSYSGLAVFGLDAGGVITMDFSAGGDPSISEMLRQMDTSGVGRLMTWVEEGGEELSIEGALVMSPDLLLHRLANGDTLLHHALHTKEHDVSHKIFQLAEKHGSAHNMRRSMSRRLKKVASDNRIRNGSLNEAEGKRRGSVLAMAKAAGGRISAAAAAGAAHLHKQNEAGKKKKARRLEEHRKQMHRVKIDEKVMNLIRLIIRMHGVTGVPLNLAENNEGQSQLELCIEKGHKLLEELLDGVSKKLAKHQLDTGGLHSNFKTWCKGAVLIARNSLVSDLLFKMLQEVELIDAPEHCCKGGLVITDRIRPTSTKSRAADVPFPKDLWDDLMDKDADEDHANLWSDHRDDDHHADDHHHDEVVQVRTSSRAHSSSVFDFTAPVERACGSRRCKGCCHSAAETCCSERHCCGRLIWEIGHSLRYYFKYGHYGGQENVKRCRPRMVPIEGFVGAECTILVEIAAAQGGSMNDNMSTMRLMKSPVIIEAIRFKWEKFGRQMYARETFIYVIYLVVLIIWTLHATNEANAQSVNKGVWMESGSCFDETRIWDYVLAGILLLLTMRYFYRWFAISVGLTVKMLHNKSSELDAGVSDLEEDSMNAVGRKMSMVANSSAKENRQILRQNSVKGSWVNLGAMGDSQRSLLYQGGEPIPTSMSGTRTGAGRSGSGESRTQSGTYKASGHVRQKSRRNTAHDLASVLGKENAASLNAMDPEALSNDEADELDGDDFDANGADFGVVKTGCCGDARKLKIMMKFFSILTDSWKMFHAILLCLVTVLIVFRYNLCYQWFQSELNREIVKNLSALCAVLGFLFFFYFLRATHAFGPLVR